MPLVYHVCPCVCTVWGSCSTNMLSYGNRTMITVYIEKGNQMKVQVYITQ